MVSRQNKNWFLCPPVEDTVFQPRLAELAPRLLCQAAGPSSTHTPDYKYVLSPMCIAVGGGDWPGPMHTWKRWTWVEGRGPRPSQLLNPSLNVDSSGSQEDHNAQSLERLIKEHDTDKSYSS